MADELDLTSGDPGRSDPDAERRRRRRQERDGGSSTGTRRSRRNDSSDDDSGSEGPSDADTRNSLDRVFDRIAKNRVAAGDKELAEVITEDAATMAQALVTATAAVPILRVPLIIGLNIIEPVMAFARMGKILYMRAILRRERKMQEAQQAQEEYDAAVAANGGQVPVQ